VTPYYQDDLVTIYHADCRDVLASLEPVGGVVTSPPYNVGDMSGGYANLAGGYASYADRMPHEQYVAWQRGLLAECWRLVSDDGAIFYNHKPRVRDGLLWTPLELNPGLPLRQIIIWARASGMNWSETHLLPMHEWIMLFAKPAFRFSKAASIVGDVWRIPQLQGNERPDHPAPYPLGLARRAVDLIAQSNRGVILDPFVGSGTTLVAAKEARAARHRHRD
jgi:site-specific DNA-methyltransferase (adenine-specific)